MPRGFRNVELCPGTGKPPYEVVQDYDMRLGIGNLGLGTCVDCGRPIAFSRKGISRHKPSAQDYDARYDGSV